MELAAGTYEVEWFAVGARETIGTEPRTVDRGSTVRFTAPRGLEGPVVLYLSVSG